MPAAPVSAGAREPGEEVSDGFSRRQAAEEDDLFADMMKEEIPMAVEEIPVEERDAAEDGETAEAAAEAEEPAEAAEAEDSPELPETEEESDEAEEEPFDYAKDILEQEEFPEPEKEAMVGWLTLFVIFAIPIGFLACMMMVVMALVFLALAAAVIAAGAFAIRSLFSGFAVFADILMVGGAAIGALALGLLFLWTAVWFLFGAIPGIVRGIIELGRDWCYKEVAE